MKIVDTYEYVSALRELTEAGNLVNMTIAGWSMNPFLANGRDVIYFEKPKRPLKKGDMVFYQRDSGQFVMHRIRRIAPDGTLTLLGDAHTEEEPGIRPEQVFALVVRVKRKNRIYTPGSFLWWFFEKVWLNIVPLRPAIMKLYGCYVREFRRQ